MVDVNMNPTPLKVIRKEVCLQVNSSFRLSKDPIPKRHSNILWKEESNEIKDFMKVEDGGVHHKRYDGRARNNELKFQRSPKHHPF